MIRVASKTQLHSLEEVRGYVADTMHVLAELPLSEAERVALLPQVYATVAARHVELEQVEVSAVGLLGRRPQG